MNSQPVKGKQEVLAPEYMDISPNPLECRRKIQQQMSNLYLGRLAPKVVAANARKKVVKKEIAGIPIIENFIPWVNYELKYIGTFDIENLARLYTLPNSINKWTCEDVRTFLTSMGFKYTAQILYKHHVDGRAFLLLRRVDVFYSFRIKIGPALKLCGLVERMRQDFLIDMTTN